MDAGKRFLAVTGGCGFVLLLVWVILVLPVQGEVDGLRTDQDTLKKKIEGDLNSAEYHGEVDLKRIQQETAALSDALGSLKKTLELRVNPEFLVEGEATVIRFKGASDELRKKLGKAASSADIAIPQDFGFPSGEIAESDLPPLMRRLDVIALVIGKAIDLGVKKVVSIVPAGIENPGKRDPLVTRESVTVELEASFDVAVRLLHALNQTTDFVALDRVTLESAGTEGDVLKISLVVSGLEVHPEAEMEVKSGGKTTSGGRWVPGR